MSPLLLALSLGLPPAHAGYGDVDENGYPSPEERALHLWTNAARVAPDEFTEYYSCSMDNWQEYEKTPQAPISMDYNLVEAARFHSDDMKENNWFDHASSDGTSFPERMARYYESSFVGENIANGYASGFDAVFGGWMCSDGHRANIMLPDWIELGTGVNGFYYTQDFGGGAADTDAPVVMGAHWPVQTSTAVELLADWHDDAAPASLVAMVDGKAHAMTLLHGAAKMGIYSVELTHDEPGCHAYWFWYKTAAGETGSFPEDGSHLYGDLCESEQGEEAAAVMWIDGQSGRNGKGPPAGSSGGADGSGEGDDGEIDFDDVDLVGCSSLPASTGGAGLLLGLGLVIGRRRRS